MLTRESTVTAQEGPRMVDETAGCINATPPKGSEKNAIRHKSICRNTCGKYRGRRLDHAYRTGQGQPAYETLKAD